MSDPTVTPTPTEPLHDVREAWREGLIQTVREALIDVWNPQDDEGRDFLADASRVAVGALLAHHPDLSLAAVSAAAPDEREALHTLLRDAERNIRDAKAGEVYAAEVNQGVLLASEQARRAAWESVERKVRAALAARPAPVVSGAEWGVRVDRPSAGEYIIPADDLAHARELQDPGEAIVRRDVGPWITVADAPAADDEGGQGA